MKSENRGINIIIGVGLYEIIYHAILILIISVSLYQSLVCVKLLCISLAESDMELNQFFYNFIYNAQSLSNEILLLRLKQLQRMHNRETRNKTETASVRVLI